MKLLFALLLLQTDYSAEGMKALQANNLDAAAEAFQKAIAADPSDYGAHFNLALTYSLAKQDAKAIPEYRKTLELKPGLYQAELNLGILLMRDRQPRRRFLNWKRLWHRSRRNCSPISTWPRPTWRRAGSSGRASLFNGIDDSTGERGGGAGAGPGATGARTVWKTRRRISRKLPKGTRNFTKRFWNWRVLTRRQTRRNWRCPFMSSFPRTPARRRDWESCCCNPPSMPMRYRAWRKRLPTIQRHRIALNWQPRTG